MERTAATMLAPNRIGSRAWGLAFRTGLKLRLRIHPGRGLGLGERGAFLVALAFLPVVPGAEPVDDHAKPAGKTVYHLPAEIVEAVSAGLPKYDPSASKPPPPAPTPVVSTTGPASDGLVHLPDFEVREETQRPIPEDAMLTEKGRLAKAMKKFPGLGFGPLAFLNAGLALEMLREEKEAADRDALADLVQRTTLTDDARSRETTKMMKEATALPNMDWTTRSAGGPVR
jgi:hypothetical protein